MFVVDKVVDEDRQGVVDSALMSEQTLPDGSKKELGPSARDAYAVFEDLCLLANAEKPHFLNLDYLHKTFALELIESVLTNYHDLFRVVCSNFFLSPTFTYATFSIPSCFCYFNITSARSFSSHSLTDQFSLLLFARLVLYFCCSSNSLWSFILRPKCS